MAHFARVHNGVVAQVVVVSNNDAPDERTGREFLVSLGLIGEWLQTSYNNNPIEGVSRGKFAGIGDSWDGTKFMSPVMLDSDELQ